MLYVIFLPLLRLYLVRSRRVYVALTYNGQVVMVKNWIARNTWRLPGGGVEKDETYEQAAVREVHEELGVPIDVGNLHLISDGIMGVDKLGYLYTVYAYQLPSMPNIKKARFEITEWGLFSSIPQGSSDSMSGLIEELKAQKLI